MKPQRGMVWLILAFKSGEKGGGMQSVPACLSLQYQPQQSLHLSLLGAKKNCSYDSTVISETIFDGPATPPR